MKLSKNMRYILIPDVHGRDFWRTAVENRQKDDVVVFLGDYVDPYPDENISNESAFRGLEDIIVLKKSDPEHIVLLLGNHDMGYLVGTDFCPSRHWDAGHESLHKLFIDYLDCFSISHMAGDILVSHAGVYPKWLSYCNLDLAEFIEFNDLLHNPEAHNTIFNDLFHVDMWRGGWSAAGSPVWADIRCASNEYNLDMEQIVGHTQLEKDPIRIGNMICIDCRRAFLLEDGVLKEIDGSPVLSLQQL